MSKFGLVVLGAHIGIHIKSEVQEILSEKILLVDLFFIDRIIEILQCFRKNDAFDKI